MKITFHGAARTVTGSKHIVHINPDKRILLDCGMFQGMGKDTLRLNSEFGFDPEEIDYVIISHAHIDHIGLLPKLVKEGYKGKIYCTPPTADLAKILLLDSARIQEGDAQYINRQREKSGRDFIKPLYTEDDAKEVFPLFETVNYNKPFRIDDDIELMYTDCGHLLGSAAVNLKLREHDKEIRLTFSGDIGRYGDILLRSPDVFPQADYIIMESTYGDRLHDMVVPAADLLLSHIERTCIEKRGKLIIPAFSVGRTQEILYLLNRLELERRLPAVPYFVDSPLSIDATQIIKHHPECFNNNVLQVLKKDEDVFAFRGLEYLRDVEDSIRLNDMREPCVIISASGMAEAGRVKHHIAHNINSANNTILIVGYCEPESLGGRLRAGAESVTIFGVHYAVKAEVKIINSLSAHGDYEDMSQWLACQDAKQVRKLFLVHGEYDVQNNFRDRLIRKGFTDVEIPYQHQTIGLGEL
ncbi:MBL fold metallo-hydrolase [Taibaiella soli]|uniref:MBL fold metallo-hydrolase n=1 Tax=Taibaiella soli TaxID=1649169 RepID=A0A2W2A9B9_9BACT|nr:MBL fold metallo-hydrolase [Taibaiella soli]PZF71945.1 MBL fold metallo-hydrolase [Taibaiella soli]